MKKLSAQRDSDSTSAGSRKRGKQEDIDASQAAPNHLGPHSSVNVDPERREGKKRQKINADEVTQAAEMDQLQAGAEFIPDDTLLRLPLSSTVVAVYSEGMEQPQTHEECLSDSERERLEGASSDGKDRDRDDCVVLIPLHQSDTTATTAWSLSPALAVFPLVAVSLPAAGSEPVAAPTARSYIASVVLGPLIDNGAGSHVYLYRADGSKLGQFSFNTATQNFEYTDTTGYAGVVIVKLVDTDDTNDYRDAAGGDKDFGIGQALLSVALVEQGTAPVLLSINPLTTAAAAKMGVTAEASTRFDATPTIPSSLAQNEALALDMVLAVNKALAKALHIVDANGNAVDLATTLVTAVIKTDGVLDHAAINGNDVASAYGRVLAVISHSLAVSKLSTLEFVKQVAEALDVARGTLSDAALQSAINQGVVDAKKVAQVPDAPIAITMAGTADSYLNRSEASVDLVINGSFVAGQVLKLTSDGAPLAFQVGGKDVTASGYVLPANAGQVTITVAKSALGADRAYLLKAELSTGASAVLGTATSGAISMEVDTIAPTLTISDNQAGVVAGEVTYTFAFSEVVQNFTTGDIALAKGTKGVFTPTLTGADAGKVFTLVVSPPAVTEGADLGLSVGQAWSDLAGNAPVGFTAAPVQGFDTLAPDLTSTASAASFVEKSPAIPVDAGIVITEGNNLDASTATVQITGAYLPAQDTLSFTADANMGAITGAAWNATTGTLSFIATGPVSSPQLMSAFAAVTYNNSSSAPDTTSRTVTFFAQDVAGNSQTAARQVNVVNVNDAPTGGVTITNNTNATRGTTTLQQGDELAAGNTLGDADGLGTITYTWKAGATTRGTGATYTLTQADVGQTITVEASYTDAQGTAESVPSSATSNVVNVNDWPYLSTSSSLYYTKNDAVPVAINTVITVADIDNATLDRGTVSLLDGFQIGQDVLSFSNIPATMGNITGTYDSVLGVMHLNSVGATATLLQWEAALRAVKYFNSSSTPILGVRKVYFALTDGMNFSLPVTSTIDVVEPPTANLFTPTLLNELKVEGNTVISNGHPKMTAVGNQGEYVVTWQGKDSLADGNDYSIYIQQFKANGLAKGKQIRLEVDGNTNSDDYFSEIAALGTDGAFVVTWFGTDRAANGADTSVYVQRFNANGTTNGSQVMLEALNNTTGSDLQPVITTVGNSGAFVVTWYGRDSGPNLGDQSIFVQLFHPDGSTNGSVVQLEAINYLSGDDYKPEIIATGDSGTYVVTWYGSEGLVDGNDTSVYVQPFNADGTVNGLTTILEPIGKLDGNDSKPVIVSVGSSGAYVVTWNGQDSAANNGDWSIYVQQFNPDGSTQGSPVLLEAIDNTTGEDNKPKIAALGTNGMYAVTWSGADSVANGGDYSIYVQQFNANGTTHGSPVQLEAINNTLGRDEDPVISAVGTAGAYVVAWSGVDSLANGADTSIYLQRFDANGATLGTPVMLEAPNYGSGADFRVSIAAVGSAGGYEVTWNGQSSATGWSNFVQGFNPDGTPVKSIVTINASTVDPDNTAVPAQSTADGKAYLVHIDIDMSTGLSALTLGNADHWNEVNVTANTTANLLATGLVDGVYGLFTANGTGNLSTRVGNALVIDKIAPVFSDPATTAVDVDENTATKVYDTQAKDNGLLTETNDTDIFYSLSGLDSALFTINNAGEISLKSSPDYETPLDSGADNTYDIIITAMDDVFNQNTKNLAIRVLDVFGV